MYPFGHMFLFSYPAVLETQLLLGVWLGLVAVGVVLFTVDFFGHTHSDVDFRANPSGSLSTIVWSGVD